MCVLYIQEYMLHFFGGWETDCQDLSAWIRLLDLESQLATCDLTRVYFKNSGWAKIRSIYPMTFNLEGVRDGERRSLLL